MTTTEKDLADRVRALEEQNAGQTAIITAMGKQLQNVSQSLQFVLSQWERPVNKPAANRPAMPPAAAVDKMARAGITAPSPKSPVAKAARSELTTAERRARLDKMMLTGN